MSVYGGDSWSAEAQHRRRRVDELLADSIGEDGQFKRLSNGRFACLVCPSQPLLDTLPMLVIHRKGSAHQVAAAKRSRKEFHQSEQIKKRIALSLSDASADSPIASPKVASYAAGVVHNSAPLLVETRKRTARLLSQRVDGPDSLENSLDAVVKLSSVSQKVETFSCKTCSSASAASDTIFEKDRKQSNSTANAIPVYHSGFHLLAPICQLNEKQQQEFQVWQEKELRLREAGWRRDALGGWFKEENVEFDSDEEAPKISS